MNTHSQYFEPLKKAFLSQDFYVADVFDMLGGFAGTWPDVAKAMSYHIRDILIEYANADDGDDDTNTKPWTETVTEAYRRTFFDPEHAAKYGTARFATPENLAQISAFITKCYSGARPYGTA